MAGATTTRDATADSTAASDVRVAVILAGGGARRMGGVDKALIELHGRRLIDYILERIDPQVDRIVISGRDDYGTGLAVIGDRDDGPVGPAAGLWAAARFFADEETPPVGFLTIPVDGPFAPLDLYEKLSSSGACAIATGPDGAPHPTFAYWRLEGLITELNDAKGQGVALVELAARRSAIRIAFSSDNALLNLNTLEDVESAKAVDSRAK